jgi:hypothetical protein
MSNPIFLIKDDDTGRYIPYVNGHGIKLLPSKVTQIIDDLTVYCNNYDDTIRLQNIKTEQDVRGRS